MSNKIIALSGGIASGKSTVAKYFEALGVPVFDADDIAHELVEPNSPFLQQVVEHFGHKILNQDGRLNRRALANITFHDWQAKEWLESLLHPVIFKLLIERAHFVKTPYAVIVIPLLIEILKKKNELSALIQNKIDRILIIDTPKALQKSRALSRPSMDEELIGKILDQQALRTERLNYADDVIINDGELATLKQAVEQLDNKYKS